MADLFTQSSASLSPCGRYRYTLSRAWDQRPMLCFVMLNPSTADADRDDPTIRRCVRFAREWGCGGLLVVNLFALRSPDPAALRSVPAAEAVGPDNDFFLSSLNQLTSWGRVREVVAAWGCHGSLHGRDAAVWRLLSRRWVECLGLTKGGHPRHPLYVPASARPVPFKLPEVAR